MQAVSQFFKYENNLSERSSSRFCAIGTIPFAGLVLFSFPANGMRGNVDYVVGETVKSENLGADTWVYGSRFAHHRKSKKTKSRRGKYDDVWRPTKSKRSRSLFLTKEEKEASDRLNRLILEQLLRDAGRW